MSCMLPASIVLGILLLAGIVDIKSRDIDPIVWMVGVPLAAGLYVYTCGSMLEGLGPLLLPLLALAYVPAVVSLALYKLGLIGGADVWALTLLAAGFPFHPQLPVPSSLAAVIVGNMTMMVHRIIVVRRVCGIKCIMKARVRIEAERILSDPRMAFWIVSTDKGMDVSQEPWEVVARQGISGRNKVAATPGLPYVAHIALGFTVYIIALFLAS